MRFRVDETIKSYRHNGMSLDRKDFGGGCCPKMTARICGQHVTINYDKDANTKPHLLLDELRIDYCPSCGEQITFETPDEYYHRLVESEVEERDREWMKALYGERGKEILLKRTGNRPRTPGDIKSTPLKDSV